MTSNSVERGFYRPGMYDLIQQSSVHGKGKKPKKAKKLHIHVSLHGKTQPHHQDVYGHGKSHGMTGRGHGAQRGQH